MIEIELILNRTDKRAFIEGLFELEQKKRILQQDKNSDRVKLLLKSAPIGNNNNDFSAASIKVVATKFEYEKNYSKILFATIFGFIIGLFYFQISNKLQSKKISRN